MSLIFKILLLTSFTVSSFALDKIFFLPKESNDAKEHILTLIKNAHDKIDIAMYNLSYKKFHKALKKASKKGIDITIIYQKSKLKLYKKFNLIKTKRKQHIKLAIIDEKIIIFGSANWKKKSFSQNYEIIQITDNKTIVSKFVKIIDELKKGKLNVRDYNFRVLYIFFSKFLHFFYASKLCKKSKNIRPGDINTIKI
ncbi:membrane bound endonuclease (nuc) [hydrothermal vent metagenome]|uniref:Membrane bound endonuclease (Nuc) n=1 Tax=hydrothermal vent metagenome TaxID=652676 RepID=A0A3B1E0Y0_9ZZZZ